MDIQADRNNQLISSYYQKYFILIKRYIFNKIGNEMDSEDLAQDVFLRLIECCNILRDDTIKPFLFTISRNLIIDHLRRQTKKQEITSYIYETTSKLSYSVEHEVLASDIERHEQIKYLTLSPQRRKVYALSRYEDKSVSEITRILNISKRTVENHLRMGRCEVREYLRKCI